MNQFERIDKHIGLKKILGPMWAGMAASSRFVNTSFLNANRLTQQMWPTTFFEYMLENMMLSKFMGSGPENIIQIDKNLSKGPGDKVTFRLIPNLEESGGYDDSDIEGNEEALRAFNFPITVHERSHGVRSAGKMTDKRTAINIRREATIALGKWAAGICVDNDLIWALSGLGNQNTYVGEGTSSIETINEKAPSSNRIIYGGQTVAGVVTTETTDALLGDADATDYADYLFGTKMISIAKRKAQLATPKFRPIMINGKGYYVMFIHPLCTKALRAETGDAGWNNIQARANVRGINNPLFTKEGSGRDRIFDGAIGVWDDVILYEYDRVQTRIAGEVFDDGDTIDTNIASGTARVARNILCGAQAGVIAWGQAWKRYEKNFDYNRKPGTAIDGIYGVSKTQFADPGASQNTNTAQQDFAVVCLDCCVAED